MDQSDIIVKETHISLLEKVTPLARQINCLDIDQIADICIKYIPEIVGVNFASLYILDEESSILHLHRHNHPFLINRIKIKRADR